MIEADKSFRFPVIRPLGDICLCFIIQKHLTTLRPHNLKPHNLKSSKPYLICFNASFTTCSTGASG